jgi:hypothetical protein
MPGLASKRKENYPRRLFGVKRLPPARWKIAGPLPGRFFA